MTIEGDNRLSPDLWARSLAWNALRSDERGTGPHTSYKVGHQPYTISAAEERTSRMLEKIALIFSLAFVSVVIAAPAQADDCTSSGGVTICAQGDARGSDTGKGPASSAHEYLVPCAVDGLCDGSDFDFAEPQEPDSPGDGRPDRPLRPNRPLLPNRPGGGIGPR